jgi:exosortase
LSAAIDWQRWLGVDRRQAWIPIGLIGLLLLAYAGLVGWEPSAGSMRYESDAEAAFFNPSQKNPTLIFVLTAWLFGRRLPRLAASATATPWAIPGLLGLLAAAAACVWAHYVETFELLIPSLSLMLLSGSLVIGGIGGFRIMRTPALFLLLAWPLPGVVLNQILFPLQLMTASATSTILHVFGMKAVTLGDFILTQGRIFHVIESCAGLRTIETLLMSAVLYAEVFGWRGWRATTLILMAPPIGMLVNQTRVLWIVLMPGSHLASVHTLQGIVMIVVGVLFLAALDWVLGLLSKRIPSRPGPEPSATPGRLVVSRASLAALAAILAVTASTNFLLAPWEEERERLPRLASLSPVLDDWKTQGGLKLEQEFMGSVGFSQWVHRSYESGDEVVELFLAGDDRRDPRSSLISKKLWYPGPGYRDEQAWSIEFDGTSAIALVLRSAERRVLSVLVFLDVESLGRESLRSLLALDRGPWRRPGQALVLRLTTEIPPEETGIEPARERLLRLYDLARPQLRELGFRLDEA